MLDASRVVEVRGAQEGSGFLIGPRLVLTAWHVLRPSAGGALAPDVKVRILRDYLATDGVNQLQERSARLIWPHTEPGEDLDFALLLVTDERPTGPGDDPVYWTELPTSGELVVEALGFPDLAIFQSRGSERAGWAPFKKRDTHPVKGTVLPGGGLIEREAHGRGTFDVVLRAEDLPEGPAVGWEGMSGAAVFAGPDLIGVVKVATEARSLHRLKALPVKRLFRRDDVAEAIRRFGLLVPPRRTALRTAYEIIGAEAFAASCKTLDRAAAKPFYGRSKDLGVLDRALAEHDRGVLLLCGQAGLGKSRLAAHWAERCASTPHTVVLQHAFSVREPDAGTRAAMVGSLVRQVALSLGPEALGGGEPGDTARLADRLATLLGTDRSEYSRLVLVLDALDEAAEPIKPWSTGLGHGVFVLATCRAEAGEEPSVLRWWREGRTPVADYTLLPLDAEAVAEWLTAATGKVFTPADPLVGRALRASEGVPLFASYLIPDALEALQAGASDPFPANFGDYARQRLTELHDHLPRTRMEGWSRGDVRDLFALLSVAKAPLSPTALRAVATSSQSTPMLRALAEGARLNELDQRVDRWLWGDAKNCA